MSENKVDIRILKQLDLERIQTIKNEGGIRPQEFDRLFHGSDLDYNLQNGELQVKGRGPVQTTSIQQENIFINAILSANTNGDNYFDIGESRAAIDKLVANGSIKANQIDPRQFLTATENLIQRRYQPIYKNTQRLDGQQSYGIYIDMLQVYNEGQRRAGLRHSKRILPMDWGPLSLTKSAANITLFVPAVVHNIFSSDDAPYMFADGLYQAQVRDRFDVNNEAIHALKSTFDKGIKDFYHIQESVDALKNVIKNGQKNEENWALNLDLGKAMEKLAEQDKQYGASYQATLQEFLKENPGTFSAEKGKDWETQVEEFFLPLRTKELWAVKGDVDVAIKKIENSSYRSALEDNLPTKELYDIFSDPDPESMWNRFESFAKEERPGFMGFGGGNKDISTFLNPSGRLNNLYFFRTAMQILYKKVNTGNPINDNARRDRALNALLDSEGDKTAGYWNLLLSTLQIVDRDPWPDERAINGFGRFLDGMLLMNLGWNTGKGLLESGRIGSLLGFKEVSLAERFPLIGRFFRGGGLSEIRAASEAKWFRPLWNGRPGMLAWLGRNTLGKIPGIKRIGDVKMLSFKPLYPLRHSELKPVRKAFDLEEGVLITERLNSNAKGVEGMAGKVFQNGNNVHLSRNHAGGGLSQAHEGIESMKGLVAETQAGIKLATRTGKRAELAAQYSEAYAKRLGLDAKKATELANETQALHRHTAEQLKIAEDAAKNIYEKTQKAQELVGEANTLMKAKDAASEAKALEKLDEAGDLMKQAAQHGKDYKNAVAEAGKSAQALEESLLRAQKLAAEINPGFWRRNIKNADKVGEMRGNVLSGKWDGVDMAKRRAAQGAEWSMMDAMAGGIVALYVTTEIDKRMIIPENPWRSDLEADWRPRPSLFRQSDDKKDQ